ncbi:hypothetical protein MKZ38_005998 [Zalerion maritima]|uniref:F-box domain-containing protein n=1 Tax=Zalerion maritima TaxID=339359 RepID=A0AAD5RJQ7_9PEZI|nr:hypothetical protein MKZ38_005998 [Zalerion maritima]
MARISMATLANLVAALHIPTRRRRQARRDAAAQQQEAAATGHGDGSAAVAQAPAPIPPAPPLPVSTAPEPSAPEPQHHHQHQQPLSTEPVPMPGMTDPANRQPPRALLPGNQSSSHEATAVAGGVTDLLRPSRPVHTPRPSASVPDLILAALPLELQLDVFGYLPVLDLIRVRDACRSWKHSVGAKMLAEALSLQNHAGWPIVFEFQGQRYPGTTYGNRRLCGGCGRPKPMRRIVRGEWAGAYLARRGVDASGAELGNEAGRGGGGVGGQREDGEKTRAPDQASKEWDVSKGMCWPCLWMAIVKGGKDLWEPEPARKRGRAQEAGESPEGGGRATAVSSFMTCNEASWEKPEDVPVWKRANISPTETFQMLDGSWRRPCGNCAKDIHTNEVPCQYCTDFGMWLRHKRCCAEGKPCEDGTQGVVLAR